MIEDLIRQQNSLQRQIDMLPKPEIGRRLVAPFLDLPGLVGVWYAGNVQRSTGNIYDSTGQGRTLSYNGNPTFNYLSSGIAYADLDGTGDYFSRADETDLDILGTETIYAAAVRGLTWGGWFRFDTLGAGIQVPMGKLTNSAGTFAYWLIYPGGPSTDIIARISSDGTAITAVTSTVALVTGRWFFIAGRFTPSTELAIFVQWAKISNTVAIPASINNSAQPLAIGGIGGTSPAGYMDGYTALCFLCANMVPDAMMGAVFQQTRSLFGV